MTDRYARIRAALAMGPTSRSWTHDFDDDEAFAVFCCHSAAEAAFITACDPDTIMTLLAERDALAVENAMLRRRDHPACVLCDNCGCVWLDNGQNPNGCPYCKQSAAVACADFTQSEKDDD